MKTKLLLILYCTTCIVINSCRKEGVQKSGNPPAPIPGNTLPVAIAGPDQFITLPVDSVLLNGSTSSYSMGLLFYRWTKISGPSSFSIITPDSSKTIINQLSEGKYQFELTVKNISGLSAKDTVSISVNPKLLSLCNSQLTPHGNLSIARADISIGTAGSKILFAGGSNGHVSSRVDIYDIISNTWSTAELSQPRWKMAVAVAGNKIFFAGGYEMGKSSSRVDIYDASVNAWSTAELSMARGYIAAASVDNKVVFAGGMDDNYDGVDVVDIYEVSTNTWSTYRLSDQKIVSAISLHNKIFFAGGATNKVDIYNASSNSWSVISRSESTGFIATIAAGNIIFWAGGEYYTGSNASYSDIVEMYDVNTGNRTYHQLSAQSFQLQSVIKNNKILFYGSPPNSVLTYTDVYDINTQTWSACSLSERIKGQTIISAGGKVYVAGGYVNGAYTNQVYLLGF